MSVNAPSVSILHLNGAISYESAAFTLSHFLSLVLTNQRQLNHDQPTHDEKWERVESSDSYGNSYSGIK